MKARLNSIKYLCIIPVFTLFACNSTGSSNSSETKAGIFRNDSAGQFQSSNLKAVNQPLTVKIEDRPNAMATLVTLTNINSSYTDTITSSPIISNPNFVLDTNTAHYPSGSTICKNGQTLSANQSCSMLVNITNYVQENQEGILELKTPTYTYRFNLSKAQVLYVGGNFSKAGLNATNFAESNIVSSQAGVCGNTASDACMVVAYNTLTKTLKEVAETNNEIYALAVDKDNQIFVAGAFTSLATRESVLTLDNSILTNKAGSSLIAHVMPNDLTPVAYANADQTVYTLATSQFDKSGNNFGNIYISGTFTNLYAGLTNQLLIGQNGTNTNLCLTASTKSGSNGVATKNVDQQIYGNGVNTSLVAFNKKSQNLEGLLIGGNSSSQNNQNIPNYKVGIVSCVGKDCANTSPLALGGTPNVIVATPDNGMLMSGSFPSINGVGPFYDNDVLVSGSIETLGLFHKIATADATVHTLLATNNDYFIGGKFAQVNETKIEGDSGLGDCSGGSYQQLCTLVDYNAVDSTTKNVFYTNSDINALASGVALQVSIPQK